MLALPLHVEESVEEITGLGCPQCPGVLMVRAEQHGRSLRFMCRIGHVYSLDELIEAKEVRTEDALWQAILTLEELGALLQDLARLAERQNQLERVGAYRDRVARARHLTAALRALVQQDRPIDLGRTSATADPDETGSAPR